MMFRHSTKSMGISLALLRIYLNTSTLPFYFVDIPTS